MRLLWSRRSIGLLLSLLISSAVAQTKPAIAPDFRAQVDKIARETLAKTGVPSASVAIVQNGRIVYLQAYGNARLNPPTPAQPDMRYSIGSISKQFTAAALLMLQQEGKLSLDDKVAKFLPDLTRGNEVTIRELLSHTSGYEDYWPEDYVMPPMLRPVTTEQILDTWARKPLNFAPGTKWEYSNTNYVIAGAIFEKASGMPLLDFLKKNVFGPLDMTTIANVDLAPLTKADAEGYMRYALGPLRPAPKEGKGWLFAAGELAMTAQDLAKWDISMIKQTVLSPASYDQMEREVVLKNGMGTRYGLGVEVMPVAGHRAIAHSGEVSGFTAMNFVFPDDGAAVAVLTNEDAARAGGDIANKIAPLLFSKQDANTAARQEQARKIFEGLQRGQIDRALFTSNCNAYFNEQALKDFASSLGPLGAPESFQQTTQQDRGGMVFRRYAVKFKDKSLVVTTYEMPDGKLEQYLVLPSGQ